MSKRFICSRRITIYSDKCHVREITRTFDLIRFAQDNVIFLLFCLQSTFPSALKLSFNCYASLSLIPLCDQPSCVHHKKSHYNEVSREASLEAVYRNNWKDGAQPRTKTISSASLLAGFCLLRALNDERQSMSLRQEKERKASFLESEAYNRSKL